MFYIFSQVFAFLSLLSVFVSFQFKDKRKLLIWHALANLFLAVSYVFLYDWVGTVLLGVAVLRCVCFAVFESKRGRGVLLSSVVALILFWVVYCVSTALMWTMWFDFVLLAGVLFLTFGNWAKGVHMVRVANFIYSVLLIIHDIFVRNWVAIAVEFVCLTSIIVFYLRRVRAVRAAGAAKSRKQRERILGEIERAEGEMPIVVN